MQNKPKVPRHIFRSNLLFCTIIDYWYIPPGDPVFKPGWFPIKVFNFEHPIIKKKLDELKSRQDRILDSKDIDGQKLERTYIQI